MLGLVDDIGRGSRRHHEAAHRHFHGRAVGAPSAVFLNLMLEHDGAQMTVIVGKRLDRTHARCVANAFLQRLLHFLVILTVGGRVAEIFAIELRDPAPTLHQW